VISCGHSPVFLRCKKSAEYNATREKRTLRSYGKNHPGRDALPIVMLLFVGIAAYGEDLPVTVEIRVAQSTVKKNQEFLVSTTVRNVGKDEESLQIWSCSYPEQWTTDNLAVHIIGAACRKNDVIQVKLKPGESYERALSIYIDVAVEHRASKPVTFRLGLERATSKKTGIASPLWSNAVTVNVTE
jgi:hypothetical protein